MAIPGQLIIKTYSDIPQSHVMTFYGRFNDSPSFLHYPSIMARAVWCSPLYIKIITIPLIIRPLLT